MNKNCKVIVDLNVLFIYESYGSFYIFGIDTSIIILPNTQTPTDKNLGATARSDP